LGLAFVFGLRNNILLIHHPPLALAVHSLCSPSTVHRGSLLAPARRSPLIGAGPGGTTQQQAPGAAQEGPGARGEPAAGPGFSAGARPAQPPHRRRAGGNHTTTSTRGGAGRAGGPGRTSRGRGAPRPGARGPGAGGQNAVLFSSSYERDETPHLAHLRLSHSFTQSTAWALGKSTHDGSLISERSPHLHPPSTITIKSPSTIHLYTVALVASLIGPRAPSQSHHPASRHASLRHRPAPPSRYASPSRTRARLLLSPALCRAA